jgi:chromosome partitioning protein
MHRIAFAMSKGGTGKTSLSSSVAVELAQMGNRVLFIDLDGQMSSTDLLGYDIETPQNYLLDGMLGVLNPDEIVQETQYKNLSLIPASLHLYSAENILAGEIANDSLLSTLVDEYEGQYDYLIIDNPPSINLINWNSLIACRQVVIPCEASHNSLLSMRHLLHAMNTLETRRNIEINNLGIICTRYDSRTKNSRNALDVLSKSFPDLMFSSVFSESVKIKDSQSNKTPITLAYPKSKSALEIQSIANEIVDRVEKKGLKNVA